MEAGKKRLAGDTARAANTDEVKELRREAKDLKEVVAEQAKAPEDEAKPKPKRSRKPRDEDDAPREKPARKAKPKGEPRKRRDEDSEPTASGEWNGPRPGFLDVSAI